MDDAKSWWRSRTIWGALVALAASLAGLAGIAIDEEASRGIADALTAIAVAGGSLVAILGRLAADRRIGRPR